MNTTLKFAFEKETKGAVRFQEVSDDGTPVFAPQVGTLYIRKSALPGRELAPSKLVPRRWVIGTYSTLYDI